MQADRARLSIFSTLSWYRWAWAPSAGRTRMPEVVLVTTSRFAWSQVIERPIMGPPATMKSPSPSSPPARATHSAKEVPTGTWRTEGFGTRPATERYLSVRGFPAMASWMASTVAALSTTAPTARGMPPGGTVRPVTSWTRTCSSPAG